MAVYERKDSMVRRSGTKSLAMVVGNCTISWQRWYEGRRRGLKKRLPVLSEDESLFSSGKRTGISLNLLYSKWQRPCFYFFSPVGVS